MPLVMIVDDDRSLRHMLTHSLHGVGLEVVEAATARTRLGAGLERSRTWFLLDIMLPGRSGLDVLRDIQAVDRRLPVIFVTADSGSSTAIEAMQLGAYDYVSKPLDLPQLNRLVQAAVDSRRLMSVSVALSARFHCRPIRKAIRRAKSRDPGSLQGDWPSCRTGCPVLIRGESGTGKSLSLRLCISTAIAKRTVHGDQLCRASRHAARK